jgi:hypothetical protein
MRYNLCHSSNVSQGGTRGHFSSVFFGKKLQVFFNFFNFYNSCNSCFFRQPSMSIVDSISLVILFSLHLCIYYFGLTLTKSFDMDKSQWVQHLFSITFSTCCMLFLLLICEMGQVFFRDLRWNFFYFYLSIALFQVLVTLPLAEARLLVAQFHGFKYKTSATLFIFFLYLFLVKHSTQSFLPNERIQGIAFLIFFFCKFFVNF